MALEMENLLVEVARFQRAHRFGKYRGIVRDVSDPDALGRVKATVPAVYDAEDSPWAMPAFPFAGPQHGLVLLPEVGDGIWIEFEGGDISRPIWSGAWWGRDQRPSPSGAKARLLATRGGHQILIDEDANEMKLVHPGGAEVKLGAGEITLTLGSCELKITTNEIDLNHGMVKVTTAGASLVNDAITFGA